MATTTPQDGSGATDVSSTWNNEASAYDGTTTTYADSNSSVTAHTIDITGFGYDALIPSDAQSIDSIVQR